MAKLIIQTTIINISSNLIGFVLTLEQLGLDGLRKLIYDINFIKIMKDISIRERGLGG